MLIWPSDPIVRSALRHSVGWMRLGPVIPVLLIELERGGNARLARLALFALCYAAPQAASYLLEMEQDGRLDQIRLSGRRPITVVAVALASVAGPWLAIGVVLTILALVRAEAPLLTLAAIAAIAGVPTTLAAFSTTVKFARERIDPRIGAAALTFMAVATAIIGADAFNFSSGKLPRLSSGTLRIYALALVVEAAMVVSCLRTLPRRLAHPPTRDTARSARFRLPPSEWILRWPGIYRGAVLGSSGFILFALFAPMGVLVRILADRDPSSIATPALYLPPLFIGSIAISLICREDAISGRLDLIRQSSKSVAVAAVEMLIGLWARFVAATVALMALTAILFDLTPAGLRSALFAFLIMAPLPLIEGWSRLWPMMLMLPLAAAIGFLWVGGSWLAIGALSAITWIAAGRMLHHPERATLSGWPGIAGMSVMCAVTMFPAAYDGTQIVALGTVTMMLPLSPLLIDPKSARHRWGQPVAIAIIVLLVGTIRYGVQAAAIAAVSVVAVWFASYRIREWEPSRPMVQAAIRVGLMVLLGQIAGVTFEAAPGELVQWLASFGVLAIAIGLVVLVEASFGIAAAIARRRSG